MAGGESVRQRIKAMNTELFTLPENFRIGTSSFSEEDWVGPFYPEKTQPRDFLKYYATRYDTVEIDATYYAIPSAGAVDGWNQKTPDGFLFAAKLPRSIVHCGSGARPRGDLVLTREATYADRDRFLNVMGRLGGKLGPLLIQFPYFNREAFSSGKKFLELLDQFLADSPVEFRYAVEIRNKAWLKPEFTDILKAHNCALALTDMAWMPHADELPKDVPLTTTDFSYVRLVGDRKQIESITGSWDKEVIDRTDSLKRWASVVSKIITKNFNTLLYINNHYAGHAPATIKKFKELLHDKS